MVWIALNKRDQIIYHMVKKCTWNSSVKNRLKNIKQLKHLNWDISNTLLIVMSPFVIDKITSAQDRAEKYKEADVRTIFVKGLNFSTTEESLKTTFGEKVKEIRLPRDNMGRSRGWVRGKHRVGKNAKMSLEYSQILCQKCVNILHFLRFFCKKKTKLSI